MFDWVNFIIYMLATTMTPGPNNIMSMSNASKVGLKQAMPFNCGVFTGFTIVTILCMIFCNYLAEVLPIIKTPMLFIGAGYMLYLAWKTMRRSGAIEEKETSISYKMGVMLQFVNPKLYIFSIVSMEVYVLPYYQGNWPALLGFSIIMASSGSFANLVWAIGGSMLKKLFSEHARIVNTVMALLLIYCAVSLFR